MSIGEVNGEWAGELAGGFTGLVTMQDDAYWSELNMRLTGIEAQLSTIDTNSAQTWNSVSDLTFGLAASYNLLNGTIRVELDATKQSAQRTEHDTSAIRSDVGTIKTKCNDIYSTLTSLNDDFAEYNVSYDADIVERDRRFSNIENYVTSNGQYLINSVMPKLNHIDSGIDSVINEIGRVGSAVQNLSSKLDTQSTEIKQKMDEGKQSVLSSIRDALYACVRCVCTLLEPIYLLCKPANDNSARANVSVAETGTVSVSASAESTMCEWNGTAQNFTVNVKQLEGYGPFESETGEHEYLYSDELKQVLALPYRR